MASNNHPLTHQACAFQKKKRVFFSPTFAKCTLTGDFWIFLLMLYVLLSHTLPLTLGNAAPGQPINPQIASPPVKL